MLQPFLIQYINTLASETIKQLVTGLLFLMYDGSATVKSRQVQWAASRRCVCSCALLRRQLLNYEITS